jgi:GNAT superfamily N-acetyltransferase
MTAADLPAVAAIADVVHVAHPEDTAVFAERLRLYAAGCRVLDGGGQALGYVLSHPGRFAEPPPLDTRLGALPEPATTYYVHDLALLPEARGSGAGSVVVGDLVRLARAAELANLSLVAVNDSAGFWRRQGFRPVADPGLDAKLASYGGGAQFMVRDV